MLKPCDHRISFPYGGPIPGIHVEAQDASDLVFYAIQIRIAIDGASDPGGRGLRQADPDGYPSLIGEERQMQMALSRAAVSRRLVPGADEFRALFQRVVAE